MWEASATFRDGNGVVLVSVRRKSNTRQAAVALAEGEMWIELSAQGLKSRMETPRDGDVIVTIASYLP